MVWKAGWDQVFAERQYGSCTWVLQHIFRETKGLSSFCFHCCARLISNWMRHMDIHYSLLYGRETVMDMIWWLLMLCIRQIMQAEYAIHVGQTVKQSKLCNAILLPPHSQICRPNVPCPIYYLGIFLPYRQAIAVGCRTCYMWYSKYSCLNRCSNLHCLKYRLLVCSGTNMFWS